jgi:hypothetical protein
MLSTEKEEQTSTQNARASKDKATSCCTFALRKHCMTHRAPLADQINEKPQRGHSPLPNQLNHDQSLTIMHCNIANNASVNSESDNMSHVNNNINNHLNDKKQLKTAKEVRLH